MKKMNLKKIVLRAAWEKFWAAFLWNAAPIT